MTKSASAPSPNPPVPRRRLRRWLKRGFLTLLTLVVLLVAFHRPILLGLIQWVGPKAAASQGLNLDWKVSGSVLGDLQITGAKTTAATGHWMPRLWVDRLGFSYDLRALLKGDMEHAVNSVVIHDLDAEVDLRQLPKTPKPTVEETKPAASPPLVWPKTIDLKNITATVTLGDGRHLIVRGLTLQIGEGMPGVFACEELRMEGGLELKNLTAQVLWEPRKVTIKNLALPKDVVLEQLVADLAEWEKGGLAATAAAHLGAARFDVDVRAGGLLAASQQIEAKIQGHHLRAEELKDLGLPKDVQFDGGELSVQVSGDPKNTAGLKGGVQLTANNIRAAGAMLDRVELGVDLDGSVAVLKSTKITRGGNVIEASGRADLPANLADWQKIRWQAQAKGDLTNIAQILNQPPPLKGSYMLEASAEGVGATPTKVNSELKAAALAFGDYKLPQLRTVVALNGQQAQLEIPALNMGAGNTGSIKVTLGMQDAMPVDAEWNISITNPVTFFATTGLAPPPEAVEGSLQTLGKAKFNVKDLTAQDFSKMGAEVSVSGSNFKYGSGRLQGLRLQAQAEKGRLKIKALSLRVNNENDIQLTGGADLKPPFAFDVDGALTLPDLNSLNSLLKAFKAPQMESGSLFGQVDGRGQLQPWQYTGNASLTAAKVRTGQMPDAADAVVEASFAGTRANLSKLEATLGPWKTAVTGVVDDKHGDLAELKVWQKQTLLLNGHARVPFDVMTNAAGEPMDVVVTAKDLRVNEILAAAGIKDIPAGVLNADIRLQGRLETVKGDVHVTLTDVKAPKAPKAFQPASLVLDMNLADKKAKTLLTVAQPPLQNFKLDAEIPLNAAELAKNPGKFQDSPIKAHLEIPESDLGFIREYAPDMIRSIPARLRVKADVSGKVGAPVIDADVDLDVKEIEWVKLDLPSVRDARVRIRAHDRKISIEDVSAVLAGGHVKLTGAVDATNFAEPTMTLQANAQEALIFRDPSTSLRANANITCAGTLKAARVSGLVELVRGRIFKEIDLTPALSLPSDVPPLPADTQRSEAKLTLPEMLKDWTFDIAVKTHDPVLIAGNLANGAVSADASLTGTGAAPLLRGGGSIDRLLLKLPFSMVKITKGVITLNPEKPFDPALDLRGESRVGNNDITMFIYGDSSAPKSRFTSTPPLSEADIVTLLATGTTLNGSTSDAATEAASRAALLYVTELYRKVFHKKKVVRTEPPKLNITLNPSAANNTNTNANDSVQATYDLSESWRIRGGFAQSGRVRAFLGYLLHFGKAAQAVDTDEAQPNLVREMGPGTGTGAGVPRAAGKAP